MEDNTMKMVWNRNRRRIAVAFCGLFLVAAVVLAQVKVPTTDAAGSEDSPLLKRYEGSVIVSYQRQGFGELSLPLSKLELVPDKMDRKNNRVHEPKTKKALEGPYTRLVYLIPEGRSPLEVLRNYQEEIRAKGGKILYECRADECGGDAGRSSEGGGGDSSLAMYLLPGDRVTDPSQSAGRCAQDRRITDLRFTAAELGEGAGHLALQTYTLLEPTASGTCFTLNKRTIAVVDIVEAKAREQRMVTVDASEMARSISATGRVALYGIYFDFNKAEVKPESDTTLAEVAKLLQATPAMNLLVVGHTDNVGTFDFNLDLSQRRAAAVVEALAARFKVSRVRLKPFGVSFASPAASNQTDDGRGKNRRVELVDNTTVAAKSG
jgi:outer membrane protein OmpA-like peptidoglycan-associated protein